MPVLKEPKVLCVGFHKTGTSSLGRALRMLDYRVAGPIGVRDPTIAATAVDRARAGLVDHDAAQDNPWPLLFRELDESVPGARFILTERPDERWLASVVRHFGGTSTPMREWIYGVGDPVGNEAVYLDRYRAHNDAVRSHFADRPDDLLVLHLEDDPGWDPLCRFLGVPVPDRPFPHVNQATFGRRFVNRLRGRVRRIGR